MTKVDAIFFDLDDTLLDTWKQLFQKAVRESCQKMIAAGLDADLDLAIEKRTELFRANPRSNICALLVEYFGLKNADEANVIKAGEEAFFDRDVDPNIQLFDGAEEMLQNLKEKYSLFLVTSGVYSTQKQKVSYLGIEPYFKKLYFVDPAKGESKKQAFQQALEEYSYLSHRCLSVGNRLDNEIAEAKDLGFLTCYMEYGEYVHMKPTDKNEIPDFKINRIDDLIRVCEL